MQKSSLRDIDMKMTYTEKLEELYPAFIGYSALYAALDGDMLAYFLTVGMILVFALLIAIIPRYK